MKKRFKIVSIFLMLSLLFITLPLSGQSIDISNENVLPEGKIIDVAPSVEASTIAEEPSQQKEINVAWYNSENSEFTIKTASDLVGLAAIVNGTAEGVSQDDFVGKTINLENDINLSGIDWLPIGKASITSGIFNVNDEGNKAFNGTFNGNGFSILEMTINRPDDSGLALFGYVGTQGVVKNTILKGTVIGNYYVGGFAAILAGTMDNLTSDVSVTGYNNFIGGIAGEGIGTSLLITNCHNLGTLNTGEGTNQGIGKIAGILGRADTGVKGKIINCSNSGTIRGYQYVAGIIGGQFGAVDVESSFNTGEIVGVSFGKVYLGGIAGKSEGGTINNCYNTGRLYNEHWAEGHVRAIGGIAGNEEGRVGGSIGITNCYNTGVIDINVSNMVQGSNWIYQLGNISGGNSASGVNTVKYGNCYYLENRIAVFQEGQPGYSLVADIYKGNPLVWDTADLVKKTNEEMKNPAFVVALGSGYINDTNMINSGFPVLAWQEGGAVEKDSFPITSSVYPDTTAKVTLSSEMAKEGDTVTVNISDLAAGKEVTSVKAIDVAGNSLAVAKVSVEEYTFIMPNRAVAVNVVTENTVLPEAASHEVKLPTGLDAIWTTAVSSTYLEEGKIKEGATVKIDVNKDEGAALSSLKGIEVKGKSGTIISVEAYRQDNDVNGSGYAGIYFFTMPEEEVEVSLKVEYVPLAIYVKKGTSEVEKIKELSRDEMLDLSKDNLYYSGYASESEGFIGKAAQGVTLKDLLASADLEMVPGSVLEVVGADGMNLSFTYEQLYGEQRYYYPNLISGATEAEKAEGKVAIDALFSIKGYLAKASEGSVEDKTLDTRNAYRFVYGQTEKEFNNGNPSVEYKVTDLMPKCISKVTLTLPEEVIIPGDIDGDSIITKDDVTLINNFILGKGTLTDKQKTAADYDGDGKITLADVLKMKRAMIR